MNEQMKKRVDRLFNRLDEIIQEQESYMEPDPESCDLCLDLDSELIQHMAARANLLNERTQQATQYAKRVYTANIQAAIDCLATAAKYSFAIPSEMWWIDIGDEVFRSSYRLAKYLRIYLETTLSKDD